MRLIINVKAAVYAIRSALNCPVDLITSCTPESLFEYMKLEEEAQKQLKALSIKFKDDSKTKEFERSSNEFEELV